MKQTMSSNEATSDVQLLIVRALSKELGEHDHQVRLSVPELAIELRKRVHVVARAVRCLEYKGAIRATREEDAAKFYRWEISV